MAPAFVLSCRPFFHAHSPLQGPESLLGSLDTKGCWDLGLMVRDLTGLFSRLQNRIGSFKELVGERYYGIVARMAQWAKHRARKVWTFSEKMGL